MAIAVVYRPPAMTAEQYNASWSGRRARRSRGRRTCCCDLNARDARDAFRKQPRMGILTSGNHLHFHIVDLTRR
jgi:hypothetical protein